MSAANPLPLWQRRTAKLLVFALALTGAAQMPIMKRYYVTDLPGMAWIGDFYLVNVLHYVFAAAFLLLGFSWLGLYVSGRLAPFRVTGSGVLRLGIVAVLIITGVLRVLKNEPEIAFSPLATLLFDWVHLVSAMCFGLAALAFMAFRRRGYLRP